MTCARIAHIVNVIGCIRIKIYNQVCDWVKCHGSDKLLPEDNDPSGGSREHLKKLFDSVLLL